MAHPALSPLPPHDLAAAGRNPAVGTPSALPRPGLLVGGGLLLAFGALTGELLEWEHWFPFALLALGALGCILSVNLGGGPSRPRLPAYDVQERSHVLGQLLGELDRLHAEGAISDAERRSKRRELLDEWGAGA